MTVTMLDAMQGLETVHTILKIIAIISTGAVAVIGWALRVLRKYSRALEKAEENNQKQQELIQESIEDRKLLHADLDDVKSGLTSLLKIELDKIYDRSTAAGEISQQDYTRAGEIDGAYVRLGGNHGMDKKMKVLDRLTITSGEDK